MTTIRKGQAPAPLTRAEFHERFATRFYDPAFAVEADAIARLEEIARWSKRRSNCVPAP